jgi:hypothetical protein
MGTTEKSAVAEKTEAARDSQKGFSVHHFSLFEKANICGAFRSTIGLNSHNPGISEIWVHTSGQFAGLVEVTAENGTELVPLATICAIKPLKNYEEEKARKESGRL